MTLPLIVKGTTYNYPQSGDEDYGAEATGWASKVTTVLNGVGYQYTYILGSAAQVLTGEAQYSDWFSLNAVLADGDSVWVKNGTYFLATGIVISKRVTIANEGTDCLHTATAGIAAGPIFSFTAAGTTWIGGTILAGAGTPDYAFQVNAIEVEVSTILDGVFAIANILFTSGAATFGGIIRDAISCNVYGTASAGANVTLSNLDPATTINSSLIPNVDSAIDLGSATPKYWANAYIDTVNAATGNITTIASTTVGADTVNVKKIVGTQINIPALDINWATGGTFYKAITGAETYTFSNTTDGASIDVIISSTVAGAVTWPAVVWPGGAVPTQTVVGTDFYSFKRVNGVIYGFQAIDMS